MSARHNLQTITGIAGSGTLATTMAFIPWLRERLATALGLKVPGGIWRVLAIVLALLNLKSLPFIWHIRLFRALYYHLYLQPTPIPPSSLFKPLITSSRSPLIECDYNLHKSNSTYFSDADIARTHLVTAILRSGMLRANKRGKDASESHLGAEAKPAGKQDRYYTALGGVACVFKKEIKPYERYEIWTRLLCWDRKWLYIVSHFVKAGSFRPSSSVLQPWNDRKEAEFETSTPEERHEKAMKGVFGTSIAKYVVKKGRLTIPPEQVLRNSDMLPDKPEGALGAGDVQTSPSDSPPLTETEILADTVGDLNNGEWTWERIETQRKKGLKYAELFGGLDGLHSVFDGGAAGSLGEFSDMIFWR